MRCLCVAVLLALLAACGGGGTATPTKSKGPEPLTVSGTVSLDATGNGVLADTGRKGAGCVGQNGYDDINEGAQVVIRDDKGKTVGVGDLISGSMATGLYALNAHCDFPYSVPGVKTAADFLSIEVAHRGPVQFKRADAGSVDLTLGGAG